MKFIKSLFSRWIIISFLIISQIICFCTIVFLFAEQYLYVSIIFEIISLLVLVGIISKSGNPNTKIPWIIVILLVPPVGIIIYGMFGNNYVSKKHRSLYQSAKDRQKNVITIDKECLKELENYSEKYLRQSNYIYNTTGDPIYKNTNMKYLKDGMDYFDNLFEDLNNAKKFIFLEYFILGKGKLLDKTIDILTKKVKEGVDVRVIYDDIGSIKVLPYNFDKKLNELGIKCIKFNKYYPIASVVYNNRDHRKLAIIDGYIGYTGGVNIADEYANIKERFGYWKDSGIRLYGQAVQSMTLMFLKTWDIYSNSKTKYKDFIPQNYDEEIFKSDGFVQPYGDGPHPVYEHAVAENVYLNLINQANKYIYITTPYLIVDHMLMSALESAALRGVEVIIITPSIPDKKIVFQETRDSYRPLIKAGVKILEYQPGFIHAKNVIVDDEACVLGTINFDYRSLVHHFENACLIINSSIIEDVKKDFIETMNSSLAPSKKVYSRRGLFVRIYFGILKFFAPLM